MAEHTPKKLDEQDKRSESFGPIALTRHVKDDGRALILYALAPSLSPSSPPPPPPPLPRTGPEPGNGTGSV